MSDLIASRTSLHGIAEWLLSGPQRAESGTIRLRIVPGGFATRKAPEVAVTGTSVIGPGGEAEIDGATLREIGAAIGVTPSSPRSLYHDDSGVTVDDLLRIDTASATQIMDGFAVGDAALAEFAPEEQRVLWPEHFDVGIGVDRVNYGVCPGDRFSDVPYAYVGPWDRSSLSDPIFNAPFGALVPLSDLPSVADVVAFFRRGRDISAKLR